jgi:hypothetical protein
MKMKTIFNTKMTPFGESPDSYLSRLFNSGKRSPDGAKMEWIGPLLITLLVFGGLVQLFWAYLVGAIARKTGQSELMQVLAWIPVLQMAPILAAGGGSIGRFLIGTVALVIGNATLLAVAAFLGDGFGSALAALGLGLTGLLCLFYFGRIACNTAIARDLPGWMGLLVFIPVVNFFAYPYLAFHDGWVGPNKVGLAIGSVLIFGSMAPTFGVIRMMEENGGVSPELIFALADLDTSGEPPIELISDTADRVRTDSKNSQPKLANHEADSIRALYALKSRFDSLDSLVTPAKLSTQDHRLRSLGVIESIRRNLESHREKLDESTFAELALHLLQVEARVHAASSPSFTASTNRRGPTAATREFEFAPAAPDPSSRPATASFNAATAAPIRPFPVQASNDCQSGTELRTSEDAQSEEEWCQQLAANGGLRHGFYARYHKDGRPESMGQYQDGLRVGVWTRFHTTGEVRAQAQFREGLQHGWVLTFNESGERTQSARFEYGTRVLPN